MRDEDWECDFHVACHHRGDLNSDFESLKVDGENATTLPEISMNADECCHQEKAACCNVWVSVNDEETLQASSAPGDVHLNLDVENTELCACSISPCHQIFVYHGDSCHIPDSCFALHSLCLAPNRGLANFLLHGSCFLCAAKHVLSHVLVLSLNVHRASRPCRLYAPKPFCLAPTLSLLWCARHGGSTHGHFEKVKCRYLFFEANVAVVTWEDDNFCLCLVRDPCLCLCLCLCRRVWDDNDLVQPLAPVGLHIACRLKAQASYLLSC